MSPSPRELFPLFHCPLCPPDSLLTAPTTLRCGHSVCSTHLRDPSLCPIPGCPALPQSFTPNIPPSSRVAFFPAPLTSHSSPDDLSPHGLDVRLNSIIHLLRASDAPQDLSLRFPSDDDSDSDLPHLHPDSDLSSRLALQHRHRPAPTSSPRPPSPTTFFQEFEKSLSGELLCDICFMLLYQPVTTPCQHTFCSKCLQRSLDHSMLCPLCRQPFPGYAYFQEHPHNKIILSLLLRTFPDVYASRGEAMEREERDARLDTPIFVCQLSFPGMPTLLHFFEPRYRLMLRRCLEKPCPTFGMIMPPRAAPIPGHGPNAGSEFGTMLEIKSVQMLADGRSMVEAWGTHRFRILEHGSLDGYMVGRTERIDDYDDDLAEWAAAVPPSPDPQPPSPSLLTRIVHRPPSPMSVTHALDSTSEQFLSTSMLLATCHAFLTQLSAGTAPWVVQRLNYTYGPQPPDTDPSAFSFWMGMVLPIDEHEKAKLLPVKSTRLRLRMVVGWIEQLNSNWWFTSGCTVL